MIRLLKATLGSLRFVRILLLILLLLFPIGLSLSSVFGYQLVLFNDTAYAAVVALFSVYTVVLYERTQEKPHCRILTLVAPVSLITSVFFMIKVMSPWIVIIMAVCVFCCICLTWIYGKPKVLKIISLILVMLMILPVGFLGFITLVFGGIGRETVVQSVPSPSGTYYAELIDSDQGALGGDTFVEVHNSRKINALLFQIEKKPQLVYHGDWGEFEDMKIFWKDDTCLVINSAEYRIN